MTQGATCEANFRFTPRIIHKYSFIKQRCNHCNNNKFLHEFPISKRHKSGYSKICKYCLALKRHNGNYKPRLRTSNQDPETMDRSIKINFIRYMINNPYYFEDAFNCPATHKNIVRAFMDINRKKH